MTDLRQWRIPPVPELPSPFRAAIEKWVTASVPGASGQYVAQLLWQRGLRDLEQIPGFLNADRYVPTTPFAFAEMQMAVQRLQLARDRGEKVAIWGDFDADGITATAVLWDGLGEFFVRSQQLTYVIPNRLTESHGLSRSGLEALAAWGATLIVTCDTGSTNLDELDYAQHLGLDVIVTDHHTLSSDRPPVTALINPRALPADHPLAHLSGVAVAYKLVEALYLTMPDVPQRPLADYLDLVAIGLIADLVQLTGDCRYLAQRGIEQLQKNQRQRQAVPPRPGIARLLELCQRSGDRPTDISFGIGPRINAISRIYGDARFCVELLTSQDGDRCRALAEATELANIRRKELQKDVMQQVQARLAQLDLSTTDVIVLADPQWPVGILGLVAGQIAQSYGRPTILLSLEKPAGENGDGEWDAGERSLDGMDAGDWALDPNQMAARPLARGSARSVNQIDLYQLVSEQAHLLHRFGGHPFAAGLSLPVDNISLLATALNQRLRQLTADRPSQPVIEADVRITVADLGQTLFRELKLLEPYGMGNPVPRLVLQNVWFQKVWHRNLKDWQGRKIRYIKTEFELWDESVSEGFPGVWWEHYKDEIPTGHCDAIVELDYNSYAKRYEVRLIDLHPTSEPIRPLASAIDWIWDWRPSQSTSANTEPAPDKRSPLKLDICPASWDELLHALRLAAQRQQPLALAYSPPSTPPIALWQQLVGIAKYLSRTGQLVPVAQLLFKLEISDRALAIGCQSLEKLGFQVQRSEETMGLTLETKRDYAEAEIATAASPFVAIVQEEQFRRRYFCDVPLTIIQQVAFNAIYEMAERIA